MKDSLAYKDSVLWNLVTCSFKEQNISYLSKKDLYQRAELRALQSATLMFFKYGTQHTEVVYAHQARAIEVLSKQEEHIHVSSSSSCHFVPKDQHKLCTHDKNRKVQNSG